MVHPPVVNHKHPSEPRPHRGAFTEITHKGCWTFQCLRWPSLCGSSWAWDSSSSLPYLFSIPDMLDMWRRCTNGWRVMKEKWIQWMVFLVKTLEVHTRHIEILYIYMYIHFLPPGVLVMVCHGQDTCQVCIWYEVGSKTSFSKAWFATSLVVWQQLHLVRAGAAKTNDLAKQNQSEHQLIPLEIWLPLVPCQWPSWDV